jgi:hypothetical protein
MSDDYHDDDSRSGGLWDPDAYVPPPEGERPTLRVIESDDSDDGSPSPGLVAGYGDTLVRLDQFRPIAPSDSRSGHGSLVRRAAALSAGVGMIAAIAVAAIKIVPDAKHQAPATTATRLSVDPEQSALVRKVGRPPAATKHRPRSDHRASTTTRRRTNPRAATPAATQVRSTPSPSTQQRSQATTASKPKRKLHQYDAVTSDTTTPELHQPVASSEFGFEN